MEYSHNMKTKAVIFDMDGLLIDSEVYWHEAEKEIWRQCGIDFDESFRKKILGLKLSDIVHVAQEENPSLVFQDAYKLFDTYASDIYTDSVSLMPGAADIIDLLFDLNIKLAIGSSSKENWVHMFLETFRLQAKIPVVCSSESLELPGKPDPAVYQECMKRLGVTPDETVVFEDTAVGTNSAKSAGAYVFSVPDDRWSHGDFSEADVILDSLKAFTINQLP